MSIDLATADALDALADVIFPLGGPGLQGPSTSVDQTMYALLAPIVATIDGRVLERAPYTLNLTMALKSRAKHWYMEINEYNTRNPGTSSKWPAFCGFILTPDVPTGWSNSAQSSGATLAIAACAATCRVWAIIIRMWLSNNYQWAVSQPTP